LTSVGGKIPSSDKEDMVFPIASASTLFVFNGFDFAMKEKFSASRRAL